MPLPASATLISTEHERKLSLRWLSFEILFKEITGRLKRGILSRSECLEVAHRLHLDESALDVGLLYLDELLLIFCYPDILPEVVFINPQVLLDKISGLVKVHDKRHQRFSRTKNQKLREMLLPTFEKEIIYYQPGANQMLFLMNAKCPGKEEEDMAQAIVSKFSTENRSDKRQLPALQCLGFEIMLKEITRRLKHAFLSRSECLEVTHRLHLDENALRDAALLYLDELSPIFCYSDILSKVVFTNSQVIFDKITEVIVTDVTSMLPNGTTMDPIMETLLGSSNCHSGQCPLHTDRSLSLNSRSFVLILNSGTTSPWSDNVVKTLNSLSCCNNLTVYTPGMKRFCHCGKCSHAALFEHSCPQAYGSQSPFLRSTTLMRCYSSDSFILPMDNWWNIQLYSAILTLGDQNVCLSLLSHDSSACDREQCFHLMDNQDNGSPINILSHAERKPTCFIATKLHIAGLLNISNSEYPFMWNKDDSTTFHTTNPGDLADLVLFLLLQAGDIEVNPGPGSERIQQTVKQLSDEVETRGLDTQKVMITNIRASLFPEVTTATKGKTLQGLYEMLSSSRKYRNHSDRIFYFVVVELLSLSIKDREQRALKEHAALQSEDVLQSKEIKFLELINFLSYEPKERLIGANILPGSAKYSSKDAAELISGLIQTGHLAPTSASLENLYKVVKNNSYKLKVKEVMIALRWNVRSMTSSELVDPDSPQLPQAFPSKTLGATSQWTAPVVLSTSSGAKSKYALDDEPVSAPTIMELAVLPSLGSAWENLGTALSINDEVLQSINKKFPTVVKKQKELFRAYLKANPNPTWSDIINALVSISKDDIARKVIDTFGLSPELLVTAKKPIRPSSSLAVSRVEPDTAELVPARVSKTEVHSSVSLSSGKPIAKSRIESDYGATLSTEVLTADTAEVSKRVSRTEILSLKKLDRPIFDSSRPQPKQPRLVSDDGVEETDSYFPVVERDSASLPPDAPDDEGELKSIPIPFGSDPIGLSDREVHSSISGSDREQSFQKEDQQSSENNGLSSSDDFHSAEETPLDNIIEKTAESDKYHKLASGSHLLHQDIKRLREAVMSRNTEEINRCISENVIVLNSILEVNRGQTALHIAAMLGFKDVAKVFLQHKALVTVKDSNGCTPLYLAASSGNYEIAKLIIASSNCDMNPINKVRLVD